MPTAGDVATFLASEPQIAKINFKFDGFPVYPSAYATDLAGLLSSRRITVLITALPAGAVTVVYAATSVESSRYTLAPLARQGTGRVVNAFAGIDSVGVVTPTSTVGGRTRLPPARAILDRDLSTLSLVLGCP